MADIFRRVEKKYIINSQQYLNLLPEILKYMEEDQYGKSVICNIYFDTENYDLIRRSIEKTFFKEKVRLRSYNTPNMDSNVYLEIKRKINNVVGKRRIKISLQDFYNFISKSNSLTNVNAQIKRELDYIFDYYKLEPKMYISYERVALYQNENRDFRVTFDSNILARTYDLKLELGNYGVNILDRNNYIMEIKTLGTIPMWFVKLINELRIKPGKFSKYGESYKKLIISDEIKQTNNIEIIA